MHVLHIVPYLPQASGVTTFVVECSDELQRIGIKQTIVVGDGNRYSVTPSSSGVQRISVNEGLEHLSVGEFDVLHLHGIWPPFMHAFIAVAVKKSVPIVWSLHGMLAPWAMRFKWWKKFPVWWLWQKRDLGKAAVLHATTEEEVGWIRRRRLKSRVEVIPLGTRMPTATSLWNEGACSQEKILLFVGRINPVKALDNLLKAWGLVKSYRGSHAWHLRIIGTDEGGYQQPLEQLAASLHLGRTVTFAGAKYNEQLEDEYRHAYGLILPSHTENFGGVVIDALARGVPVIASDKTPWESIARNDCGWWVDNAPRKLADAIIGLMTLTDDERRAMGEKGRHFIAERYTWQVVARAMKGVYESVFQSKV